jgi:DNA helicase IV
MRSTTDRNSRIAQIDAEQQTVDEMYRRLDKEITDRSTALDRQWSAPRDGLGDLFARDAEIARLNNRLRALRDAEPSLCFGRIDPSDERGESLYIGRIGLTGDDGGSLLVDWRAEAARPFYAATMVAPAGIRRRRHLTVDRRRVGEISDEILDGSSPTDDDIVTDGPLVSALSAARTGRMRQAAATLQAEQDEIVRSPHQGVTVVDGGPGTGKTVVALHRAAYVLYAFPALADRGLLVYGPNRRFLTYISDVLPSLGENDVRLATLPDIVGTEATRTEPDHIARIKGRAVLADAIARRVRRRKPHGRSLSVRIDDETVTLDAAVVDMARKKTTGTDLGHNREQEIFTGHIVEELVDELERRSAREQADYEAELAETLGIDLDRIAGVDDGQQDDGDLGIDWDLVRDELLEDPAVTRAVQKVWPRISPEKVVRGVLGDWKVLASLLPDVPDEDLARMAPGEPYGWSDADLALLDEARALIHGAPETVYGHIVVDEAQQLTEMQWRMLMRRCPGRSLTVVGDLAQAGPTTTVTTWQDALAPFVSDRFVHHRLTVNYRTTEEILQSTAPLLARIAPDQEMSRSLRHGDEPVVIEASPDDSGTVPAPLLTGLARDFPDDLVGIVAAPDRVAALEDALAGAPYAGPVSVIAAPEARGLEFDSVIIVDPDGIAASGDAGLRDLYVARTRATKRLFSIRVA